VTEAFKKMINEKSVVCIFFPRGNNVNDQHDDICNLEVANPFVYKQYLHKTAKMLHMHVKFTPHPRSLDGTNPPSKASLREFGFSEVNTAITNAINVITNIETAKTNPAPVVTLSQVQSLISQATDEMIGYTDQIKEDAIHETQTYTDIVTEDFKEKLDNRFDQLMELLLGTRKVLQGSSSRAALGGPEN
jgi:hypothetical protein